MLRFLFLFSIPFVLIQCKKEPLEIEEPFPEKTNDSLIYFGYTLVDVYFDDPTDAEEKTNYVDEVAPFSNIADILIIEPTDDITDRLDLMTSNEMQAVIHLNELFFEIVGTVEDKSGTDYDLRSDYEARWDLFVSTNNLDIDPSQIAAFYLGEEPTWNSISAEEFALASDYIKATVPDVPIMLIEAYPSIAELVIPASVDWVGFDHYFIADPTKSSVFQSELADLKSKQASHQKIILVLDAHHIPLVHGTAGIAASDMDVVARNYYKLANSEEDVIGMIGYHWPSGFEFNNAKGTRGLPMNVRKEHEMIGKSITGKE